MLKPLWFAYRMYRGRKPASEEEVKQLAEFGIRCIVTLQEHSNDIQRWAWKYGIRVIEYNLSSVWPPSKYDTNFIIDEVLTTLKDNYTAVYVCCVLGHDRTGVVCARAQIKWGMAREAAIILYRKYRSWWLFWWEYFI